MTLDFAFVLDIRSHVSLTRFLIAHSAICDCLSLFPSRSFETPWKEWREMIFSQVNIGAILESDEYRVEFDAEEIVVYSQLDDSFVQRQKITEFFAAYDRIIALQLSYDGLKYDLDFQKFKQTNVDLLVLPAAICIGLLIPELDSKRVYVSPLREEVSDWANAQHGGERVKSFWLKDFHDSTLAGISVRIDEDLVRRAVKLREHSRREGLKCNWKWAVQYSPVCAVRLLASRHCSFLEDDAIVS